MPNANNKMEHVTIWIPFVVGQYLT